MMFFKKTTISLVAAGALIASTVAFAQNVIVPQVTSINPGADLVQVIPGGSPSAQSQYATVALIRGVSATTGLPVGTLPLIGFKNSDGTTLAATAAAGKFGIAITAGTSEDLISEAANSNTKTDVAIAEVVLPSTYVAGQNITVTANTNYNVGSGTVGTHTLTAAAYLTTNAGVQGATLIATAAQTVPAAAGNVTFTITGASLVPGSRLLLSFSLVIQDTGGSNITAQVNSVGLI